MQQIDAVVRRQIGDQLGHFGPVLRLDDSDLLFVREIAKNLFAELQIGMPQDPPRIGRIESFHELRRAGRMQCGAEFLQLKRVVFGEHLAQFGQEQRVDHDALGAKKDTAGRGAVCQLRGNPEYRANRQNCQRRSACYNWLIHFEERSMTTIRPKRKVKSNLATQRIVSTAGICGGSPRIAGTRIPVAVLLRCRALGFTEARILEGYPALSKADLTAAWAFADKAQKLLLSGPDHWVHVEHFCE